MFGTVQSQLSLATKVNRLFEVFHAVNKPEQSTATVAASISALTGQAIEPTQLEVLRTETAASPDWVIIEGLTRHFSIPVEYLATDGEAAERLDQQLRLLAAARDAGVKRLALRGSLCDASVLLNLFAEVFGTASNTVC
jgi:hypothetical protein